MKIKPIILFFDNNQISFFQSDYSIHTNKRIFIDSIINQSNVLGKKQKQKKSFAFHFQSIQSIDDKENLQTNNCQILGKNNSIPFFLL